MADEFAWQDRDRMLNLFSKLQRSIDDFKEYSKQAHKFKMGVLDHPGRLAELKKIIDIDPNWTLTDEPGQTSIQAEYNKFKEIYDYLTT